MTKVKLQDIAQAAGVSIMTVSRVINKDPKVRTKTRERISHLINEMGYKPNTAARHLAGTKSYCIAVVCEYANASYVNKFLTASLRKCRTIGYHVVLDELGSLNHGTNTKMQELVDLSSVDGVVLLPPTSDNPELISMLKKAGKSFVRIAPNDDLLASPYICIDDYQAAFDITESLIKSGKKQIAHIIGSESQGVSRLRYQGYLDALKSNQLEAPPEYTVQGDFSYKSGFECAKRLLALNNPPDAIFAANDEMAAATVSVAHMMHKNVPQSLSIVGFDDTEIATVVWPQLTTVSQPLEEMANLAIELLINPKVESADTAESASKRYVLEYAIKTRESSFLSS